MSLKNLLVLTCSTLVIFSSAFASQYNFTGFTPLYEACAIRFDIDSKNSLTINEVSGTALKYDKNGFEILTITNPYSVRLFDVPEINAYYLSESTFQIGKYKNGIIVKEKNGIIVQEKDISEIGINTIELKGKSISKLESIYAVTDYGFLSAKIGYKCENLRLAEFVK